MEEQDIKQGSDSLWVDKNTKGYVFGAKVYKTLEDTPETLQLRLDGYLEYLNNKYGNKEG